MYNTGYKVEYWSNGNIYHEVSYRNNEKHGTERYYNDKGILFCKTQYKGGLRSGIETYYYDNLSVRSTNYYILGCKVTEEVYHRRMLTEKYMAERAQTQC